MNADDSSTSITKRCGIVLLSPLESFYCDSVPSNENRSTLVNSLIKAYEVDKNSNVQLIPLRKANFDQLVKFHDKEYIKFLLKPRHRVNDDNFGQQRKNIAIHEQVSDGVDATDVDDDEDDDHDIIDEDEFDSTDERKDDDIDILNRYGLIYDCPIFPNMDKYVKITAGSTLSAANWIIDQKNSSLSSCPGRGEEDAKEDIKLISMNWHGGRHHGKKDKASGFCYINDIVLAITRLRSKFSKIMYIDFDLHHGDGVSQAFRMSNKVLTLSVHRYDLGFFPGTGDILKDKGVGKGFEYDVNLPMRKGLSNKSLLQLTKDIIIPLIKNKFKPDCLVIQCGCDGLNTDEHKEWNLTIRGFGKVLNEILNNSSAIPTLLLGGGGYNHTEAAKFWTYLTFVAASDGDDELNDWDLIPDHEHLEAYEEDGFQFWKNERETNMKDLNDDEWLQYLTDEVTSRDFF